MDGCVYKWITSHLYFSVFFCIFVPQSTCIIQQTTTLTLLQLSNIYTRNITSEEILIRKFFLLTFQSLVNFMFKGARWTDGINIYTTFFPFSKYRKKNFLFIFIVVCWVRLFDSVDDIKVSHPKKIYKKFYIWNRKVEKNTHFCVVKI
jgi:hypothetical protein